MADAAEEGTERDAVCDAIARRLGAVYDDVTACR
jgi:hypothetical protein